MAQNIIEPLTLEQLREMDGEPVWVEGIKKWGIVDMMDKVVAIPGYAVVPLVQLATEVFTLTSHPTSIVDTDP